ncbi:MAG: NUDIX domain-containing protein [Caldilineales bacterium]|nr:NUDIX domain-containing protein [Caldilineales bacterium]
MAELRFERGPGVTAGADMLLGCAVAVIDEWGRVLLQRRTDGDYWGLPGGRMETGDTFIEAARREVREETGLEIEIDRLLGLYSDPELCVIYPNGKRVQVASATFVAAIVGGEMIESNEETAELRWFHSHDLPPNILPTHIPRLTDLFHCPPLLHID